MARIHARRKGKSGSKHPVERKDHPKWSSLNTREVELHVIELAKKGKSTSEIGTILRDQFAVPDIKIATGKSISKILKSNNLKTEIPEDLRNLIQRALTIQKHIDENKKDLNSKRNLQLTESKIRRLTKYYIANKVLPVDWKYSLNKAKLMFE